MEQRDWDENYRSGETPWDMGRPEPLFVEALSASVLPEGRALEIGCGTGINARLFAEAGYDVVAVDLSPTAIETARSHPASAGIRFEVLDVLSAPLPDGPPFDVVDRGVFHVFDGHDERARYAGVVAEALRPGGCWLTLAGSTEGPPRDPRAALHPPLTGSGGATHQRESARHLRLQAHRRELARHSRRQAGVGVDHGDATVWLSRWYDQTKGSRWPSSPTTPPPRSTASSPTPTTRSRGCSRREEQTPKRRLAATRSATRSSSRASGRS